MCFDKTPKHLIICIGTKVKIHTILVLFIVLLCWTELSFIILISLSWLKKKNTIFIFPLPIFLSESDKLDIYFMVLHVLQFAVI